MFSIIDGIDKNCIVISNSRTLRISLFEILADTGVKFCFLKNLNECSSILKHTSDNNFILVDVDSLGGIGALFDDIKQLRENHPLHPLILLSGEFFSDEYGPHRLMLADVSLKIPLTFYSIELGFIQAPVNNKIWQSRMKENELMAIR